MPLAPKDDTAARRARSTTGHAVRSCSSRTAPVLQSTCEDGVSACRVRGSSPARIAMTILITPATPDAACVWPMFDFTAPSSSGADRSCP